VCVAVCAAVCVAVCVAVPVSVYFALGTASVCAVHMTKKVLQRDSVHVCVSARSCVCVLVFAYLRVCVCLQACAMFVRLHLVIG